METIKMDVKGGNEMELKTKLVELMEAVASETKTTPKFRTVLKRLDRTLRNIEPMLRESGRLSKVLDRPKQETEMFVKYLGNGKRLVMECSGIKCWNVYKKFVHANKLIHLDHELLRFFRVELQDDMSVSMRALTEIYDLGDKMDQVLSTVANRAGGFLSYCSVPGLPDFIVGLDGHLLELKRILLKDDNQVVTVSAPGGCGKTTLVKMLCHDNEIKGIFGDNIFYITVSRTASLKTIVEKIFAHHLHVKNCEFQNDEDAKNQLETMLSQMGSEKILLVLDDVWGESESIIRDLKFPISGYKILMVKSCKGLPLALTTVGASLRGQGEHKWRTTLKKWSEGQSIFDSNSELLVSLRASVDALEHLPIAHECFLDLGSFPEDEKIAASALMDLWVELYGLDKEGMYAIECLLELSSRNLLNLTVSSKDASELEGYCNEHYVTQHDLLRELAIHLSSQEPIPQRTRMLIEIHGNDIPTWWIEQTQQLTSARLLSITTDETFSSVWNDLKAPKVEVLVLNTQGKTYTLPHFIKTMNELKALNITSYGIYPSELHELTLISYLSNLKRMRLEHVSLSPSVQSISQLKKLQKLSFIMCEIGNALESSAVDSPPAPSNLMEFEMTNALESCLIDSSPMPPNLTELEFNGCYDLKQIPASICHLVHLEKLSITNCHELDALPKGLGSLSNLEILRLHSCTRLASLPESIGNLHNLVFLDISDCLGINSLPYQIGELNGLRVFKMSGCHGLEELPTSVTNLSLLEDVICDEETSCLWRYYENDLRDVKINVVEDDRLANLMKIVG
ncbi:hypothetical protein M8C21_015506 [Ambrosia artemisiifolia]|uniref:RPW8 domain-containing protein n=1 Tax=Ambrosia artemisiifolia TaxID=4212 RepID=A0AAD5DAM6_AMBAR|nr:hypothetical protein M8C21_015506 [Ambrosia artemisiifolia]